MDQLQMHTLSSAIHRPWLRALWVQRTCTRRMAFVGWRKSRWTFQRSMRTGLDPAWFSCGETLKSEDPRYRRKKKVRGVLEVAK